MIKLKDILFEATISYKNDTTKKKELGIGAHFVFSGRQKIGMFHVKEIGTIEFDPMDKIKQKGKGPSLNNTIFMFGGMAIMQSGQGIGRQVIQKIFKDNPNIQHIVLYTTDQAIGFWNKLKGKVLGEKDGVYYMQIDRTALNEKAKSSPGRVKRAGASCKGSVTDLRARAKKYGGEKGKMYHWCANMKSGKKK